VRQAVGQVARQAHLAARALIGLSLAVLLALAALGWRLAQGPIELPVLARAIEAQGTAPGGIRLEVGQASVAWDGLRSSGLTPLQLRLSGVRILGPDGALRAALPDAAVSLSLPWLLRGEIAPSRLELRAPELRLRRDAEGHVAVELAAGPVAETPPGTARLEDLLAEMMRPPTEATPLGALSLVVITGAHLTVEDARLGVTWSLDEAGVELRRLPVGGITGRFGAMLRLGAERIPLAGSGEAHGDSQGAPAELALRLSLPELHPAALAALAPPLAPLAALDAPARLDLAARLGADGVVREGRVTLGAGAGAIVLGADQRLPIAALDAVAEWRPEGVRLTRAALRLDGPGAPLLRAEGLLSRSVEGWRARGTLALDALPLAHLARWWPAGLGAGERDWILANITAGTARNGAWMIEAEAAADFADPRLVALHGTLDVEDATVHWLRPIPPAEGARGRVRFDLREVTVEVAGGRQSGTQVAVRDGTLLRFLLPEDGMPTAEMQVAVGGPVADVLAVLQHPRLRLFERRPVPVRNPQGQAEGRLTLGFPLLAALTVEEMRIAATAQLRQLRVAEAVMGRALDRGSLDLAVDNDGLRVAGTAHIAEIAARIAVEMDFRAGPPGQVVLRENVTARATTQQLAALGLLHEDLARGTVALDVRGERRRNGQGRVTLRADLRDAALAIEPLSWSKPAGQNAGADAVLRLSGDNLEAVESFRIEAPSLLLRGNAAFARGARLERVSINEGRLEDSRFGGEARPPTRPGAPWTVTLRGQVLDLRRMMAEETPQGGAQPPPPPAEPGPAISLDGRFERVLLAPGRELAGVEARVALDGRGVMREGRLAGRTGPQAPFEATITPEGRGRALRLVAQDAGALLHAFGVLRNLQGGRLEVTGRYAHNGPGAPLTGTAEMSDFAVLNAPSFAKLLQAMTLYGLLDALAGPGVGFARLVAPFTLTPDTLSLDEARAFSASLGLTARGSLDRRRQRIAMEGTIVPAYLINTLLGNLPIIGRLFSPETGGGLFAATWQLRGPLDDPQVSVNPLAALTPGILRGIFGSSLPMPDAPAP